MANKTQNEKKTTNRRTQVKDLPKDEKQLGESEMKKVRGGAAGSVDGKHVLEKSGTIN